MIFFSDSKSAWMPFMESHQRDYKNIRVKIGFIQCKDIFFNGQTYFQLCSGQSNKIWESDIIRIMITMGKGCRHNSLQFSLESERSVYSLPTQWFSGKVLVHFQGVKSLEALTFSFLKGPTLLQVVFVFKTKSYTIKETM